MSEVNTPISLTLVDLHNAVLIIDAASERGAFKGPELSSVGAVRDKIAAIVEEHSPKEAPTEEVTETPDAPEPVAKKTRKAKSTTAKKEKK